MLHRSDPEDCGARGYYITPRGAPGQNGRAESRRFVSAQPKQILIASEQSRHAISGVIAPCAKLDRS